MGDVEHPVKTRSVVPIRIRKSKRVFGALILETSEYPDITDDARNELITVAETVSIVIRNHKITDAQQKRTDEAIEALEDLLDKPMPPLTKPNLFLDF